MIRRFSLAQRRLILALDAFEFRDWKALAKNVRTRRAVQELTEFQQTGPISLYFMRRLNAEGTKVQLSLMGFGGWHP